jgi:glycosyltransferase involved in cell wall biosynthesis
MSTNSGQKSILFLSGSDFKEKSIQVIRKTPEAYVQRGWKVVYIVGRDNSKAGDYFYEAVIDPPGVEVIRFTVPLAGVHDLVDSVLWRAVWFRIRNLLLVIGLAARGIRELRRRNFDVLYGYEIPGVLAFRLVKALGYGRACKFVTRFQGVLYVKEWLRRGQNFRKISNFEAFMALGTPSDICIMTNDGSQGLDVLRSIGARHKKILFYTNGVDPVDVDPVKLQQVREQYYNHSDVVYFLSVSRLDAHKRIDRSIRVISKLLHHYKIANVRFVVVGAGAEEQRLRALIDREGVAGVVNMIGAVRHNEVKYHLECADIFLSMYTSTNVGNPLLEAIRHNKIVVTLANGDTGTWIKHLDNGLIYPVDDVADLQESDYINMAGDLQKLILQQELQKVLKTNIRRTETEKLWTWEERFEAELNEVSNLLN